MGDADGVSIRLVGEVAWLKVEVTEGEGESAGVLKSAVLTAAEVLTGSGETWQAWVQHHLRGREMEERERH